VPLALSPRCTFHVVYGGSTKGIRGRRGNDDDDGGGDDVRGDDDLLLLFPLAEGL